MKLLQLIERLNSIAEKSGEDFDVELAVEQSAGFLPLEIAEVVVMGPISGPKTVWLKG